MYRLGRTGSSDKDAPRLSFHQRALVPSQYTLPVLAYVQSLPFRGRNISSTLLAFFDLNFVMRSPKNTDSGSIGMSR